MTVGSDILIRETFIDPLKKDLSEGACMIGDVEVEGHKGTILPGGNCRGIRNISSGG